MKKPNVRILCTGNSCRSHMAEGILRYCGGDLFEIFSAGSKPAGYVHPDTQTPTTADKDRSASNQPTTRRLNQ